MGTAPTQAAEQPGYRILAPNGAELPVTKEVFEAVWFFHQTKRSGEANLQFRNGGVAGIEMKFRVLPESKSKI